MRVIKTVRIHVVTFRRPALLERALRSLLAQSFKDWVAEVLNDDPEDHRPAEVIQSLSDSRISIGGPKGRLGAAARFNQAFRVLEEPFSALLEDDNWWEPSFLERMIESLEENPNIELVCCNERIWREEVDGSWTDTGRLIWPSDGQPYLFNWDDLDKCGGAKLCNSAMLFRTRCARAWRTPDTIPVDVTEHFRERVVPHPFLLHPAPLVNYAETIHTYRTSRGSTWGQYQAMLVASLFSCIKKSDQIALANRVWIRVRSIAPQSATTCILVAITHKSCRQLAFGAKISDWLWFIAWCIWHPIITWQIMRAHHLHAAEWQFLLGAMKLRRNDEDSICRERVQ